MRLVLKLIFLITITFISFPDFMFAQQDTTEIEMVRLELTDGSTIVGDIIEEDEKPESELPAFIFVWRVHSIQSRI